MTTEERKKLQQANKEGRDWGIRIGADAMRILILKMELPPAVADKIKAIDINNFKIGEI